MLNWWLGRPVEGKYVPDENPEPEQPETPAPVFAARALKSAIFGTPAPLDETIYENDDTKDMDLMVTKEATKLQPRSTSPTKPPGILLTPGTATTRRKTVSFGNEIAEKGEKAGTIKAGGKKGQRDGSLGKVPSLWTSSSEDSTKAARKTSFTKTLENSREGKAPRTGLESARSSFELPPLPNPTSKENKDFSAPKPEMKEPLLPQPPAQTAIRPGQANHDPTRDVLEPAPINSDATMDLNEPHSQSGRYWKSEYEQYHAAAKAQMERLINYKILAKSFAKMKDDEAIAMTQKLEEEQQKVIQMENKVSQLSVKIANSDPNGKNNSPEMMKDLARQTALALQYRAEVDEFRTTMENSCREPTRSDLVQRRGSGSSKSEVVSVNDSKRTREQLKELDTIRTEVEKLRRNLTSVEEKNTKLQNENRKLTQDLLHADLRHTSHLEKCDQRRDSFDTQLQRKDERLQNLQKDFDKFKDIAKKSRRDAEILLKKRHDQIVQLRREISSLRGAESTAQDFKQVLHQQALAHVEVINHLQEQNENPPETQEADLYHGQDFEELKKTGDQKNLPMSSLKSKDPYVYESPFKRDSQIPVLTSVSRPSKALALTTKSSRSEPLASARRRSSNRALSEIVNGASVDTIPPEGFGPVQHTPVPIQMIPLASPYSSMSPGSPDLQLPSPEPSLPLYNSTRAIHERNCHASPRPSMFNITSSPPKATFVRPRSNELNKRRSSNNLGAIPMPSMGADTSRVRREMAPDRLAAAKARLEQKRRMKDSEAQKENLEH